MVFSDRERWDRKYAARRPDSGFAPDPLLVEHAPWLEGRGVALDVACGQGDNALYLAQLGNEVYAVDISEIAIQRLLQRAHRHRLTVHAFVADLDLWRPPAARFDLITVFRFLNRTLIPSLKQALRPGGLLVYRTWNRNHLLNKPDFRPEYLLARGELQTLMTGLTCMGSNDTLDNAAPESWWIGRQ